MAPSTVFSYWRRDHRRPGPPSHPDSPLAVPPGTFIETAPQLPGLPPTLTLTDTIIESAALSDSHSPSPFNEQPPDPQKLEEGGPYGLSPQHSLTNLRVPSSSSEQLARPHSSPEDSFKPGAFTSQPNDSQQSISLSRSDQHETHPHKASSSWRLGFTRSAPAQQLDEHRDVAPYDGMAGSNLRINTSTEAIGFVGGASLKDVKPEFVISRRDSHHQDPSVEHAHQKSGKTKLHLLNPMSLLARRRSSQFMSSRQEDTSFGGKSSRVPAIPDDYDPRIRGSIVHDFSAPRPRRNVPGAQGPQPLDQESSSRPPQQQKRHSEHAPVFKEHFGDDRKILQIENKGYLQSSLLTSSAMNEQDPSELPAFARKLPFRVPENDSQPVERTIEVSEPPPPSTPPKQSPPRVTADAIPQVSSVPNRLKSNASRFSFDMSGVGSSVQEKLLEEKHKEKEAARREKARQERSSYSDFDEEDFDYDAMEDDGCFEERIPGVNADADDDDFSGVSRMMRTAQAPLFVPALPTIAASPVSPADSYLGILPTPRDGQSQMIGYAATSKSPFLDQRRSSSDYGDSLEEEKQWTNPGPEDPGTVALPTVSQNTEATDISQSVEDDDLYYDDGDFGDFPTDVGDGGFDESVFDDENSQLYDRQFYTGTRIPVAMQTLPDSDHPVEPIESESVNESNLRHVPSLASEFRPESWDIRNGLSSKFTGGEAPKAPSGVLTEHNLEAFHTALARVADDKRLQRNLSVSETSLGQESIARTADSHPGLISDDSRLSQTMGFDDVLDDFNYDDDGFDDDPIIAEANAEALENDDEGFYGQEFGFYAHSHGDCNTKPFYGGFFGPQGVEGINRSFSGRANFREPSLTPITERSEWSTRNSIISLTTHGAAAAQSNPSLASPALAQLVDMGSIDDEISLGALMKLRRGAFGGSNGSLRSSTDSLSPQAAPAAPSNRASFLSIPEGSPISLNATTEADSHLAESTSSLGGGHYISSPLSDGESAPGSPTLTLSHPAAPRRSSTGEGGDSVHAAGKTSKSPHSRTSSSASISYVQEIDEDGFSKWVLERRRTSGSGELEVYQREVLGGGRI